MVSFKDLETLPLILDNAPCRPTDASVVSTYSTHTKSDYIEYVSATASAASCAAESSQTAFESWSWSPPGVRRAILQKTAVLLRENFGELVRIQVLETNCPESWAAANVNWAALHLEEMAGRITSAMAGELPVVQTPGQTGMVFKRPVGPVLSIPPWNAAVFLATRAIDTPLAVGCTVVLKASEQSPHTHHFLAGLFHQAGLPAGVLNVIQTRREDAAATTEALIAHSAIHKIEFIGSAAVGKHIGALAGKHLKPIMMELGGKAAALVLDDANLELAAGGSVYGAYSHHGQTCFSTERIIVNASIYDKFIEALKQAAARFPPVGAISTAGAERTLRLVKEAVSKGAEVIYGEPKLLDEAKVHPIVLSGVTPKMELSDEESFGPVLAVYKVNNDQEAIDLANKSKGGLAAGIFSQDIGRALDVARQIEVGQTHINWPLGTGNDEATLPVGLSKGSGWGKTNGSYGMNEFLELRTVTITNPSIFLPAMRAQGFEM